MHNQKKDNKFKNKKNDQNCQKIELYGSLTTKELKKKHSSILIGGAKMESWGREVTWQGGSWKMGWVRQRLEDQLILHSCAEKPGGTTEERDRPGNPGF